MFAMQTRSVLSHEKCAIAREVAHCAEKCLLMANVKCCALAQRKGKKIERYCADLEVLIEEMSIMRKCAQASSYTLYSPAEIYSELSKTVNQ